EQAEAAAQDLFVFQHALGDQDLRFMDGEVEPLLGPLAGVAARYPPADEGDQAGEQQDDPRGGGVMEDGADSRAFGGGRHGGGRRAATEEKILEQSKRLGFG